MNKFATTAAVAALALSAVLPGIAAPKMEHGSMMHGSMMHGGKMMHGKMMHGKMASTVYACKECKMYYTPAQAKSMHYKDDMGHTLTKIAKAPAGFTSGGKMGGKMMDHGKM